MKNILLTACALLVMSHLSAQDKTTVKADMLFDTYQYVGAIEEYLKLAESKNANTYIFSRLGESYYNVFDAENASKWFAKAIKGKTVDAETYYHYAQTLKALGKYQEANKIMDVFAKMLPKDERAKEHLANPDYIPSLTSSKAFDVADTNINAKDESNFGALLAQDNQLYFASTRNASNRTDKWNNQPYLDIYRAGRNANGTLSEATPVKELNTAFHDGPITLSQDGNTMYFARDSHSEGQYEKNKKANIKIGRQGIYKAVKTDGKWNVVEALPFNSTTYSVTNPSLSADGKTLYFASDMPGGFGESDIWKVSVTGNSYGKPENLGALVNTASRENFPFIAENNTLYFASMGRQGYGGYDVFKIDLNQTTQPENMGKPINSEKDDFSFSFNQEKRVGYFSSNRNGSDAIYQAIPTCRAKAIIVVTNSKTKAPIAEASVAILDGKGNVIAAEQSDASGRVTYDIDCKVGYGLQVKAKNFEVADAAIAPLQSGETIVEVPLVPTSVIITDTEVILKSIYFEYDKSNITAQGATELDKLVKVMKENPAMVIFVKSHTDSNGSDAYNLSLSERRAQSTVQYIISKGITPDRISGKGYGSTEQKVKCGKKCTPEQDAQNRRSEFMIVKK
ncbi:OmpA family protein [Flavobacterium sp.]|uniref:OmpA family protein n=1 Tax=Flavobacterium sp. TaxID=239 RepID=UPI002FDE4CA6